MRYLGNKTALLDRISQSAAQIGFTGGTVCDLFAGSAVVGRHFRAAGNRVLANDLMESSYVFQQVFLEIAGVPEFAELREQVDLPPAATPFDRVVRHLEQEVEPVTGLLTRQYSPGAGGERRYFTADNAARLDGMLAAVRSWREAGWLQSTEQALVIAALLNGADRVANISGTYGAYLKKWQTNAEQPLRLIVPEFVAGPVGRAHHQDAFAWLPEVTADLLYLDPPYNHRQYPANYHLMEIIARIPVEADLAAFEGSIYGKTGLVPWQGKRSRLCSGRGSECADAFRELLQSTSIPRLVVSYSEEGIISRAEFDDILAEYAGVATLDRHLSEVPYRRFRSDADGRKSRTGAGRAYRQLPGREKDEVCEWLFHVAKRGFAP
ncbi:MAG: DNA adenine methylase [Planctomycetota bacterium]